MAVNPKRGSLWARSDHSSDEIRNIGQVESEMGRNFSHV